jgi:RNA polymerase sigma factor (sigma-70 family)
VGRAHRLPTHDIDDAMQRTWLSLLLHVGDIRDAACLGSWLTTTMRRECLTLLRRGENPVGDWLLYADRCADRCAELEDPEAALEALDERERGRELWALVGQLPERERCLLTELFGPDEPSYAEVSSRTGLPIGAIGPTRQRALRRLRALRARRPRTPVLAAA